jgi:ribonuclease T2
MLDVMPSAKLVDHEWTKHGTCSGLAPDAYFEKARAAFGSVKIPVAYQNPSDAFTTTVAEVEQAFGGENARLQPNDIAVICSGRFLQELRVCLDKDLQPRTCGSDIKDGCRGTITVRPVR